MAIKKKQKKRGFWDRLKDGVLTIHGARNTVSDPFIGYKALRGVGGYVWGRTTTNRNNDIPLEVRNQARYAQASYLAPDQRAKRIDNAVYMGDLSSDTLAVYNDKGRYHIGIRGTANREDVISDINVAGTSGIGSEHSRVREVRGLLNRIKGTPSNTTLYGHSLGGSIATRVSDDTHIRSENFNTGSTFLNTQGNKYARHHLIDGDPISNSAIGNLPSDQVRVYRRDKKHNAHTLDQFGPV